MPSDIELISTLQDRIAAKLDTQTSLAKELAVSQGHLCKVLKSRKLTPKMRVRVSGYLEKPHVLEAETRDLIVARRVLRKCEQMMHNMQYLLTDVQRMCDQIASMGEKAKR